MQFPHRYTLWGCVMQTFSEPAYQHTSGAEGFTVHAPWMHHYLHCCRNLSQHCFINLVRCCASLHVAACIFSCCRNPTLPFSTFAETNCPTMNHEILSTLPTSQHRSALKLFPTFFYSGAAQWQRRCLCWQVGSDMCQGASSSMREGTWSANEPTDVSVERTRKNNLQEVKVGVSLLRRSKISLWVEFRQTACLNTCTVCLRYVFYCQIILWNFNFTKLVCVRSKAQRELKGWRPQIQ